MKANKNDDNLYPVNSEVYVKVNPALRLVVSDYKQRIYYCRPLNSDEPATLAFYERELSLQ